MNIHNAKIVVSAVGPKQYPVENMPEIALAGRSNVGKSSFINKMLNRKNLARTSSSPGKTAQINFYNIDDTMHFVDLPGYGYAAVSKSEKQRWGVMIDEYLNSRAQLCHTFLLVDARHKPTADDIRMAEWILNRYGFLVVIATKLDKLKKSQTEQNLGIIKAVLRLEDDDILVPFSAEKGTGVEEAWEVVKSLCKIE